MNLKFVKMKYLKLTLVTLVIAALAITACKDEFLDVNPTGSLTKVELSSKAGLDGAVISAYSVLLGRDGFYSDASNWFWGSILGGEANKGSNAGDQAQMNEVQTYATQPNNSGVLSKYRTSYEGIARANASLGLIAKAGSEVPADFKTRLQGEARFLRGHYYFELKKIFNNTPYVDETWDEVTPVKNDADLWPKIESDFKFAYENLPAKQADAGRANKWAAASYLAKTYLYQKKWTEAKALFDKIIAEGVTAKGDKYGLVSDYRKAFRASNDNNKEAIFSSQAAAETGSINNANPALVLNFPHANGAPGNQTTCCGFFQPSLELANSFRTDAKGLPLPDGSYNNDANKLKTDLGISWKTTFTPDAGNIDPRLDHSLGRRGIPYLDWGDHPGSGWVRDQAYAGPYAPKKYVFYKDAAGVPEFDNSSWTAGYPTVNVHIIRFADVLLMAAECEIELGNLNAGMKLINQVRTRAANSLLKRADGTNAANYVIGNYKAFADKTQALAAVRMERKLELSGEGHRFFDLNRWGIATKTLNDYLNHERKYLNSIFTGAQFTDTDVYQPIPQPEIDLQGREVLTQNPGYN